MSQAAPTLPASYRIAASGTFKRNAFLTLAQILAVVQGGVTMIGGVYALFGQVPFSDVFSTTSLPSALSGEIVLDGVIVIVIGLALIVAASRLTRPSPGARWFLIAWELLTFAFVLALEQRWGIVGALPDASLVLVYSNGLNFADGFPALVVAALILYGLLIHRPTCRAFGDYD